jgi:tetratricopeptide (TPR) repeat protein
VQVGAARALAELEAGYGAAAVAEWRLVLRGFELGEGFSLIVLIVPDRVCAEICRKDLAAFLAGREQRLEWLKTGTPDALAGVTARLLELPRDDRRGAIWIESVYSRNSADHHAWDRAWNRALGSLNQQRNPLRRETNVPLIFVGAEALVETMREIAPDLWSVRAFVARIRPMGPASRSATAEHIAGSIVITGDSNRITSNATVRDSDPLLAQRAAERLRGQPGQERSLADILIRMARAYADRDDWNAAEAGWKEAVELRRQGSPPEALAGALDGWSLALRELGRREDALAAAEEAVRLYRALAAARPDAFAPNLAASLNNVANGLSALGRREDALAAAEEAVRLRRGLAAARPDAFTPDLALSLNNVAAMLGNLGQWDGALAAVQEAEHLYRALTATRPDAFTPDLAASLSNVAAMLGNLGQWEKALASAEEAVRLFRVLAAARPDAFTRDLATSLNNVANTLNKLDRREGALAAAEEAVSLHRALVAARPDAFMMGLARSLGPLGMTKAAMGDHAGAVAAFGEGIERLTPVFARYPEAVGGLMLALAQLYTGACEAAGRTPDTALLEPVMPAMQRAQAAGQPGGGDTE